MVAPAGPGVVSSIAGSPYTMFVGTDYAHLMIPVEDYYRYQGQN